MLFGFCVCFSQERSVMVPIKRSGLHSGSRNGVSYAHGWVGWSPFLLPWSLVGALLLWSECFGWDPRKPLPNWVLPGS